MLIGMISTAVEDGAGVMGWATIAVADWIAAAVVVFTGQASGDVPVTSVGAARGAVAVAVVGTRTGLVGTTPTGLAGSAAV